MTQVDTGSSVGTRCAPARHAATPVCEPPAEFSVTNKDERPGPEELTVPPGLAARPGVTPAVHAQAPGALLKARLEHLSSQTKKLEELKERQTERLVEQRARTAERAQQAAELQQQVEEMELRKRDQELEKAELIEKRRQKTSEIAGYRSTVEMTQSSYAELSQRQSLEQLQQEELIVVLRSWCRQVALCNGGYQLEISRVVLRRSAL
ncbi:hypothetical protein FJT64_013047 [Amphibalanus amphitrite]|uniref:Uncharacterized protein n=1 Tax=Amphibalanus amphitrite TaxID=1232801 RepID=A0A6A4VDY7_AMPAM|nr:hypothetical protein FJT64_013047 [Amphibalanus amphitrite]